jgi:hypothetical protein
MKKEGEHMQMKSQRPLRGEVECFVLSVGRFLTCLPRLYGVHQLMNIHIQIFKYIQIWIQGDTRPAGAVPPRLPVSVRRSASLAKCSALLKGDGSQVNELRRRWCEGAMFLD